LIARPTVLTGVGRTAEVFQGLTELAGVTQTTRAGERVHTPDTCTMITTGHVISTLIYNVRAIFSVVSVHAQTGIIVDRE